MFSSSFFRYLFSYIRSEGFTTAEVDKIFSGYQPLQLFKNYQFFRRHLCPHLQVSLFYRYHFLELFSPHQLLPSFALVHWGASINKTGRLCLCLAANRQTQSGFITKRPASPPNPWPPTLYLVFSIILFIKLPGRVSDHSPPSSCPCALIN